MKSTVFSERVNSARLADLPEPSWILRLPLAGIASLGLTLAGCGGLNPLCSSRRPSSNGTSLHNPGSRGCWEQISTSPASRL